MESGVRKAVARNETTIHIADIIGEPPHRNEKLDAVVKEIKSKVGWGAIKNAVDVLIEICDRNYELQLKGKILHCFRPQILNLNNLETMFFRPGDFTCLTQ